ncbi:MAG: PIG-L family deacetylase [Gemmataceae bacterium]
MPDAVLAVLAHPDDAEFLCAGTLVRLHRELGWQVHIATMTPGDCGSAEHSADDIARIRRAEGAAAAARLGGQYHCLEERDLLVSYADSALAKVTQLLRTVSPRIVFAHSPDDYHLDHEMASKLVRAAAFAAPVPLYLTGKGGPAPLHHIPHLYYCDPLEGKDVFGRPIPPSVRIDVSSAIDEKTAMLACHASQRNWLLKHHGVDSYIDSMKEWGATRGRECGVAFAEGFRQHLGHSYPQDNLLGELLGTC